MLGYCSKLWCDVAIAAAQSHGGLIASALTDHARQGEGIVHLIRGRVSVTEKRCISKADQPSNSGSGASAPSFTNNALTFSSSTLTPGISCRWRETSLDGKAFASKRLRIVRPLFFIGHAACYCGNPNPS